MRCMISQNVPGLVASYAADFQPLGDTQMKIYFTMSQALQLMLTLLTVYFFSHRKQQLEGIEPSHEETARSTAD
jgi:hypothetical protein